MSPELTMKEIFYISLVQNGIVYFCSFLYVKINQRFGLKDITVLIESLLLGCIQNKRPKVQEGPRGTVYVYPL